MTRRAVLGALVIGVLVTVLFARPDAARAAITVTWTGGDASNSLWSDPDNWSPSVPAAGDTIVFPQAASRKVNVNDFPANTVFSAVIFTGSGYTVIGNPIVITSSLRNEPSSGTNIVELAIGGGAAVEQESGTLVVAGANTFTGVATVQGGTLVAAHDEALGDDAAGTRVLDDGRLTLQAGVEILEEVQIEGDGGDGLGALRSPSGLTVVGQVVLTESATIGVGNSQLTIQDLSGMPAAGELALVGGGKLVVNSSVFDGEINVLEGNLTWHAGAGVDVVVDGGGWLRGTGAVSSLEVEGGLVWPGAGDDPATLVVTGPTVFETGAFRVDLDGPLAGIDYGQLSTGSLAFASNVAGLEIDLGYTPTPGQVFTIIQVGGGAVAGSFRDLPEGAAAHVDGWVFEISYKGGDGNDVTLKALRQVGADLGVTLTAQPSPVAPGGLLVYTVTATNSGPDSAAGARVSMGTPVGTAFESASGPASWSCSKPTTSASVVCDGPTMASGQPAVLTFRFRVNAGAPSALSGTASVFGATSDPSSLNNAQTLITPVGSGGSGAFKLRLPGIAADSAGVSSQG